MELESSQQHELLAIVGLGDSGIADFDAELTASYKVVPRRCLLESRVVSRRKTGGVYQAYVNSSARKFNLQNNEYIYHQQDSRACHHHAGQALLQNHRA